MRASVTCGPFSLLWRDLWTNRRGLDLEVTVGRRIYSLAFGFGRGVKFTKGRA